MKKSKSPSFEMTSYEKLFKNAAISIGLVDKQIIEIPIEQLHAFSNHPFRVIDDERMEELVASIKENGVMVPGICRKCADRSYEIISGHRRAHAAKKAGIETVPMIIMEYSDEEAVEVMVDANLQRENLLPSEKARAYRQKYEARKKLKRKNHGLTTEDLGKEGGDNYKTVQRYLWLSRLSDGLMEMVDSKKLGFIPGVDISFLTAGEQGWVEKVLKSERVSVTKQKGERLKELSRKKQLDEKKVREILQDKKAASRKFTIDRNRLDDYLDQEYTQEQLEELIFSLLDKWREEGGKL